MIFLYIFLFLLFFLHFKKIFLCFYVKTGLLIVPFLHVYCCCLAGGIASESLIGPQAGLVTTFLAIGVPVSLSWSYLVPELFAQVSMMLCFCYKDKVVLLGFYR